jgi:16S rRNA (cytosine1402-N4)-methyltransferase
MPRYGYHEPVLLEAVLGFLGSSEAGLMLDGTVGGGGHARALLEALPGCRLLGADRDPEALEEAGRILAPYGERVRLVRLRFDQVPDDPEVQRVGLVAALLDLGVSSHQLDATGRGFAFRRGVLLDMRMGGGEEGGLTAAELLNQSSERELARIFGEYGEEPKARRLAKQVVRRRQRAPFRVSDDLVGALAAALGRAPGQREKARVFQGVRIAVNDELASLERALAGIREVMSPEGVLVVISYHSLEDRIVKNAFREWSRECVCPPRIPVCTCRGRALGTLLTRSPLAPDEVEIDRNPRARSARLRAWRKAA